MPCKCSSCRSESLRLGLSNEDCSFCATTLNNTLYYSFVGDRLSCETCYKNNYKVCRICGQTHLKADIMPEEINVRGSIISVCKKCVSTQFKICNGCNKLHYIQDLNKYNDNTLYCHDCFTARFDTCGNCHTIFPKTETTYKIWGGKTVACKKCWNWLGPIIRYEHTNYLKFMGIPELSGNANAAQILEHKERLNKTLFYGLELECVVADGVKSKRGPKAQEVFDCFEKDFVVMKEDRSVMELSGFEIVTCPSTFAFQIEAWNKFFDKLPTNLASYAQEMCGLHVHASRAPLSVLTIAKLLVFINNPENKSFIEFIAGRPANRYCRIMKKKYKDAGMNGLGFGRQHEDRHEAINLMNRHTIEFRIFKGTLKRATFFKALEFVDAAIRFCSCGENSIKHCQSADNYIEYVKRNKKSYPHLWAFICAAWSSKSHNHTEIVKENLNWIQKYGFGTLDNEI